MKVSKITALVLAAALSATMLSACSKEKKPVSSGINIISSQGQGGDMRFVVDPNAEANNYYFVYNDVKVIIGVQVDKVVAALGNNYTYTEAASCAGQGISKIYTYNGGSFSIETQPVDTADYISTINFGDDSVSTAEGIFIGNTVDQVKKAYGEPAKDSTDETLIYEKGSSRITFSIEDGKVTSIFYQAKQ